MNRSNIVISKILILCFFQSDSKIQNFLPIKFQPETDEAATSRSHQQQKITISNACVNALKFDSNSNNSFDELISMTSSNQQQQEASPHRVKQINQQEVSFTSVKAASKSVKNPASRPNGDVEVKGEESQSNPGSTSPPPPPSIGSLPLMSSSHSAPSPTKLPQFYPYTVSSGHVMHRPIPILQKADATLSSLISNLTAASHLVSSSSASSSSSSSPQNLNAEQKSSKSTLSKTMPKTLTKPIRQTVLKPPPHAT